MEKQNANSNSDGMFTLTDEAITVEKVALDETSQFISTQVSKVTNEESGQNKQNYQNN
jgi:hypothetical protein